MSKTFGYARVSTGDQDLAVQQAALKAAGCAVVFAEKASGSTTDARPELDRLLAILDSGDTFVVTRLDRLARSTTDLLRIAADLKVRGVHFKATEQSIDTTTPEGVLFYTLLAAFGQFELAIRAARQKEGIAAAMTKGVYKGRPPTIDASAVAKLKASGSNVTEIAKKLKISRMSVYRALETTPVA